MLLNRATKGAFKTPHIRTHWPLCLWNSAPNQTQHRLCVCVCKSVLRAHRPSEQPKTLHISPNIHIACLSWVCEPSAWHSSPWTTNMTRIVVPFTPRNTHQTPVAALLSLSLGSQLWLLIKLAVCWFCQHVYLLFLSATIVRSHWDLHVFFLLS